MLSQVIAKGYEEYYSLAMLVATVYKGTHLRVRVAEKVGFADRHDDKIAIGTFDDG